MKHKEITEIFEFHKINYTLEKEYNWRYVSEDINKFNRSKTENIEYFKKCLHNCTAVFDGNIFICPRAGVFYLKHLYEFENGEQVSLNKYDKELRKKLINFYSRDYFTACDYCSYLEDCQKGSITPALQIEKNALV